MHRSNMIRVDRIDRTRWKVIAKNRGHNQFMVKTTVEISRGVWTSKPSRLVTLSTPSSSSTFVVDTTAPTGLFCARKPRLMFFVLNSRTSAQLKIGAVGKTERSIGTCRSAGIFQNSDFNFERRKHGSHTVSLQSSRYSRRLQIILEHFLQTKRYLPCDRERSRFASKDFPGGLLTPGVGRRWLAQNRVRNSRHRVLIVNFEPNHHVYLGGKQPDTRLLSTIEWARQRVDTRTLYARHRHWLRGV